MSTEGHRARKKRLMRQQLTDTATAMFLAQGFDTVRVADVARACGVSEKTVFNYFPTKESLLLDRWDDTLTALRDALTELPPVEAALRVLHADLQALTSRLDEDPAGGTAMLRRFGEMIDTTPSLRAHRRDLMDGLVAVAADAIALRTGVDQAEPEPRMTAMALLGLWQIQFSALTRYADGSRTPTELRAAVTGDVERAAAVLSPGSGTLA